MPNHILNELSISAPLSTVAPLVLNDEGCIDFEVLLPLPLNFWNGHVGAEHKKVFPGDGMSWSVANWGTKWNAYGLDAEAEHYQPVTENGGRTVLTFKTAWSPPMGWVVALFNKLRLSMDLTSLDEGSDHAVNDRFAWNVGMGPWEDGPQWNRTQAPADETERLRCLYWGTEEWAKIKAEMEEEE